MDLAFQDRAVPASAALEKPVLLWHLLSLDAPSVAALWTWAIARQSGLSLPDSAVAAMFLAVWILYAADRLLDTHAPAAELEVRHRFHARHRGLFRLALGAASVALIPLLLALPAAAVRLYLLLATLLLAWFITIHRPVPRQGGAGPRRLPKEFAVGLFFAAAVFIPTVARLPHLRLRLLPLAVLFASLCSLNCLYIFAWEHAPGRSRSCAHATTRTALRHLPALTLLVITAALTLALTQRSPLALALAVSAALLLLLDRHRPADPTLLRAAADLALLTPLLLL